jgi:copper resistance protein C
MGCRLRVERMFGRGVAGKAGSAVKLARLVIGAAVLVLAAVPALAHTVLVASHPSGEATVTDALDEVRLEFNEPVTAPQVDVTDPAGQPVTEGEATVDGPVVVQALRPLEEHGPHTVDYRVVAADGHPIEGTFVFHYAGPLAEQPDPEADPAPPAAEHVEEPAPGAQEDAAHSGTMPAAAQPAARDLQPVGLVALAALLAVVLAATVRFRRTPSGAFRPDDAADSEQARRRTPSAV